MKEKFDAGLNVKEFLEDVREYKTRDDLEVFLQLQDKDDPDINVRYSCPDTALKQLMYIPRQDRIVITTGSGVSISLNRVSENAEITREIIPNTRISGLYIEYSFVFENLTAILDVIFPVGEEMEYTENEEDSHDSN